MRKTIHANDASHMWAWLWFLDPFQYPEWPIVPTV